MLTLVPVDLSGEEVTIFNTPLWALGPYNAEEGPSTTSIALHPQRTRELHYMQSALGGNICHPSISQS